jgi:hypothetical protein
MSRTRGAYPSGWFQSLAVNIIRSRLVNQLIVLIAIESNPLTNQNSNENYHLSPKN